MATAIIRHPRTAVITSVHGEHFIFDFSSVPGVAHPWGAGKTVCHVVRQGAPFASVHTYCSKSDVWDTRRGEKEALRKALRVLNFGRPERARIWEAYFEQRR